MCNKGQFPKIKMRNKGFKMKLRTLIPIKIIQYAIKDNEKGNEKDNEKDNKKRQQMGQRDETTHATVRRDIEAVRQDNDAARQDNE